MPDGLVAAAKPLEALLLAAALGALVSLCQWRERKRSDILQAEILLAVAGAMMVLVVEDSMARALGLFGLGSFVRFRTTLNNPKDLAIVFMLVAVGMACGLHSYAMAVALSLFACAIIVTLAGAPWARSTRTFRLDVDTLGDLETARPLVLEAFDKLGIAFDERQTSYAEQRLSYRIQPRPEVGLADLRAYLRERLGPNLKNVELSRESDEDLYV